MACKIPAVNKLCMLLSLLISHFNQISSMDCFQQNLDQVRIQVCLTSDNQDGRQNSHAYQFVCCDHSNLAMFVEFLSIFIDRLLPSNSFFIHGLLPSNSFFIHGLLTSNSRPSLKMGFVRRTIKNGRRL